MSPREARRRFTPWRVLNYIDEFVSVLIILAGLAFIVVLALDGARVIHLPLVALVVAWMALRWALGSNVWNWVRRRDR